MGKLVPQVEKVVIHADLKKSSSKHHKKPTVLKSIKKIQKIKKALKHKLKKPIETSSKVYFYHFFLIIIHWNLKEPRNTSLSRIIWCNISIYILNLYLFFTPIFTLCFKFYTLWVFQNIFSKLKVTRNKIVWNFLFKSIFVYPSF